MLRNYLKIAFRNFWKYKSYTLINVGGLAVGMAGSMLILLWLQNELSFDEFHSNKENIYEVYGLTTVDGKSVAINQTSQPLGPALKNSFSEVENYARVANTSDLLLTSREKSFSTVKGNFVDPSFLQVFNFPLIRGDKSNQLTAIHSIVITEKLARKLFGDQDAVGQIVKIGLMDNFTVSGVLKDLPPNTRFDFEYLLPWDYLKDLGWNNDAWLSNNISTFVVLNSRTDLTAFNSKISDFTRVNAGNKEAWTHFLFPLKQWHLYAEFENGMPAGGQIERVRLFGIIAGVILLIACINFINLSTAKSDQRAKEVGVRKVVGAQKSLIVAQFYLDALVMSSFAGIAALLLVSLSLPAFNVLINTRLVLPVGNGYFWLCIVGFILFTSLVSGIYPAFYLSSVKPIALFKKQLRVNQSVVSPRKVLVAFQFTVTIALIIATIIIHNQIRYGQARDIGYSKNNLIYIDFAGDVEKKYGLVQQELLQSGAAVSMTKSLRGITQGGNRAWGFRWQGENPKDVGNVTISYVSADANLVKTMGFQLLMGRDIDIYKYPADSTSVLLNETASKRMGFQNPIGQLITEPSRNRTWQVVGVIKDFVQSSPYEQTLPMIIEGPASQFNSVHVRLNPLTSTSENLRKIEQVFKKYNPDYPFDYHFVDQDFAKAFANEQRSKTLSGLFAFLSIFISCLGLYGLVSFVAVQKTKEIGIRKVLGASIFSVWALLSKDFLKLIAIAFLIATPIAWYVMHQWLQNFAYRMAISWEIFALAGGVSLLIALVTISYQAIRAGLANPVKSLRSE